MRNAQRPASKAQSLLEVLVSLGLLTTAILGLLGVLSCINGAQEGGSQRQQAIQLLSQQLQEQSRRGYSALLACVGSGLADQNLTFQGVQYHLSYSVNPCSSNPSDPDARLLQLHGQIEWVQKEQVSQAAGSGGAVSAQAARKLELACLVAP